MKPLISSWMIINCSVVMAIIAVIPSHLKIKEKALKYASKLFTSKQHNLPASDDASPNIVILESSEKGIPNNGHEPKYHERVYKKLQVLGKGAFATVYLCQCSVTKNLFALKVLKKRRLIELNQIGRTLSERRILSQYSHPFIATLHCAFETQSSVVMVMDYYAGADLYTLLDRNIRLSQDTAVFFAASISLGLSHLHECEIIYRDLKPENLLLDHHGYLCLTDFGLAKENMKDGKVATSICGSAEYIAPEVIREKYYGGSSSGYDYAVDLWSLGCIIYEMLAGTPPFFSSTNKSGLYERILRGKVSYPSYFTSDAASIISALLRLNPVERLGYQNHKDLFNHSFFRHVSWDALKNKDLRIIPQQLAAKFNYGDSNLNNFDSEFTSIEVSGEIRSERRIKNSSSTSIINDFEGFDWSYSL